MSQQPLQGFHLAMLAFLRCLHDTRLQPPDLTMTFGPVDPVPARRVVGGCTRLLFRSHLLFPLQRFSNSLVMKDHAEVCSLSRPVILPISFYRFNRYPLHYRAAFAFSALLYPHYYQLSSQSACPHRAVIRVYRVPHSLQGRVRSHLSTGSYDVRASSVRRKRASYVPVLGQACQCLWPVSD